MLGVPVVNGFTYDQQSEPVGPLAGQLWRERSAGGLIVNEWEWRGSAWVSLNPVTMSLALSSSGSTTYPALGFEAPKCLFTQCRVSINPVTNPASPFDASNYRELYLARNAGLAGFAVFTFRPLINRLTASTYISEMNYVNPGGASFFSGTTTVGSPGTLNAPSISFVYKEMR